MIQVAVTEPVLNRRHHGFCWNCWTIPVWSFACCLLLLGISEELVRFHMSGTLLGRSGDLYLCWNQPGSGSATFHVVSASIVRSSTKLLWTFCRSRQVENPLDLQTLMLIKMLRLARLARLIRTLRFAFFWSLVAWTKALVHQSCCSAKSACKRRQRVATISYLLPLHLPKLLPPSRPVREPVATSLFKNSFN